ncbi:precorrin-6A synthase (deacetylating) [Novosphingobium nitrogenifigens DSM 19370]|uniref:Precorrin-6A synthase [deacetylating] n=1 Tax=Novosphingobium nitrogenifigens DSM 19370 TaxID=983920 RepID=F1Z381_9SPHN|nr:precorrin-6A synthase (deacetylating) [Novosphingobium nitrogenifigens]EGD60932.1 precorrin-6A synthase (deacetylating) [Novosphingobium nitrogenifigens DSM 19370]
MTGAPPRELVLIGIGTGSIEHLTLQAVREINAADLILIPRKGAAKADLAHLRRAICNEVLSNPATRIAEFDLPERDPATPDYLRRVDDWHDAIAQVWAATIAAHLLEGTGRIALLIWGDPALYDSSLRIAARLGTMTVRVVPGIMSINMLTAAHAIALNRIGAPFIVTTGRRLREEGWPQGTDTAIVMLDGECSFTHLDPGGMTIWWGAYVGMPEQILIEGPLAEVRDRILATRAQARARHGWIMDIYLLRKDAA